MNKRSLDKYLDGIKDHIQATEQGHYGGVGMQPKDLIESIGAGKGFYVGNIIKYTVRYYKKRNRKDLLKIAHYTQLLEGLDNE